MSTKEIIIVFDLGPGDGGKGGVVHKLSCHHQAHTIIKVGGAQGSHGVSTQGYKFAFSQWGCGTFEGVRTHITPRMIVSPEGLLNESDGLRYCGVTNAFDLLTVDERALVATPYHGIASRLKEIARGSNPRGTIGTGVGEAFRDSERNPEEIIRMGDLRGDVRAKMSDVRNRLLEELRLLVFDTVFLPDDRAIVEEEMQLLEDPGFLDHNVWQFQEAGRRANIVGPDYMKREIFERDGVAVVESSHGILTDNHYGFQPHVSAIRTLPSFTHDMLVDAGFDREITKIGVHRAYSVRHGAGPMPTTDPAMSEDLLPGSCKEDNRYQGSIRVGPLDFVLLRYAVDVCGGQTAIDGLAISWFDQIARNGTWRVCNGYDENGEYDRNYFYNSKRIKIFSGDPVTRPDYQGGLCQSLFACKPDVQSIALPDSMEEQYRLCDRELRDKLGVPVHLVSFGPAEQDKLMKDVA